MKKRMFTDDIASSGKFLRLSQGAQALYFHLGLNADDDGVVEAFSVMRMVGAKEDDLVLLNEREFVTVLDEKELVFWMTGWQDYNKIDHRIKEDSKYLPLLLAKVEGLEIVQSTKSEANRRRYQRLKVERSLKKGNDPHEINGGSPADHRVDPVCAHTTSIDKISIDKINSPISPLLPKKAGREMGRGEASVSGDTVASLTPNTQKWFLLFQESMGFKITKNMADNQKALNTIVTAHGTEELRHALTALGIAKRLRKRDQPYFLQYITSFLKIRDHWDNIQSFMASQVLESFTATKIVEIS